METIKQYVADNPYVWGVFTILFGLFFLLAAIYDWKIIYGDVSTVTYNLNKIDGWINMFGKKTARVIGGAFSVLLILLGIVICWLCLCF